MMTLCYYSNIRYSCPSSHQVLCIVLGCFLTLPKIICSTRWDLSSWYRVIVSDLVFLSFSINRSNSWSFLTKLLAYWFIPVLFRSRICPFDSFLVKAEKLESYCLRVWRGVFYTDSTGDINTGNKLRIEALLKEEITGQWGAGVLLVLRCEYLFTNKIFKNHTMWIIFHILYYQSNSHNFKNQYNITVDLQTEVSTHLYILVSMESL